MNLRVCLPILSLLVASEIADAEEAGNTPLWSGPFFKDLAFVGNQVVAFDSLRCQTFQIDLRTGAHLTEPVITTAQADGPSTCADELLGSALLLRRPNADIVVDVLTRKPLVQLSPTAPQIEYGWVSAGGILVAIERYRSHLLPLPPRQLRAFDQATGRPVWSVALPPDHNVVFPPAFDGERLYLRLEGKDPRATTLMALSLRDGSLVWQFAGGGLHPRVGSSGVVDANAKQVILLDASTGAVHWKRPLPQPIIDAVVGKELVHVVWEWPRKAVLLTLAATDGHEVWRTILPHRPETSPREPHALWESAGRVFHLGSQNHEAGLLSGFDSLTGRPTLSYWVMNGTNVGASNAKPGLVWATQRPWTTVAFDPQRVLSPRTVAVSGTVTIPSGRAAKGRSFAGIRVCSIDGCVSPNPDGQFIVHAKGRGEIPFWIEGEDWLKSLYGRRRLPPLHAYHLAPHGLRVDAETKQSEVWNPRLWPTLELTPVR